MALIWWLKNYHITSSSFVVGGTGYITFKLGGGKNTDLCYVEIVDAETDDVLAIYGNTMFNDKENKYYSANGKVKDLSADGYYMANMVSYKADLSEFIGRSVKIKIVDNASNDWGLFFVDDFVTYYDSLDAINEKYVIAENLK